MLSELDKRYTGADYSDNTNMDSIKPEQIKPLKEKGAFPMCMRSMQTALEKTHHLKYKARLQYGLFLKGIGKNNALNIYDRFISPTETVLAAFEEVFQLCNFTNFLLPIQAFQWMMRFDIFVENSHDPTSMQINLTKNILMESVTITEKKEKKSIGLLGTV